ncbi:MAG: DUF11 domain-containing protein, partial [Actinomycetia bacterium]|nr:DUF11 domain-containing protein [Actinomycetes bacterium]
MRLLRGEDPSDCRPSDLELNSMVVTTGEVLKDQESDPTYSTQRLYRNVDLEIFYFNNTADSTQNCDRVGPQLEPGPFGDDYHQVIATTVEWAVPATDDAGVWRVVVVYNDGSVDGEGRGRWTPVELADDGGTWRGSVEVTGSSRLTYMIQAVDRRGNVTWLEYTTTELPASGVPLGLPDPVDVDILLGTADLGLTVSDAPDPVQTESPLVYTLTVTNHGPDAASSLVVSDVLPGDVSYVISGGEGWSCGADAGVVTCGRGFLDAAESAPPITILVDSPALTGTIVNLASVGAFQIDPNAANDTASEATEVVVLADLTIGHDDAQSSAVPGETITYSITVTNNGPAEVNSVWVIEDLPPEILDPVWTPAVGTYDPATGRWDSVDLAAGESATLTLTGTIDPAATGQLESGSTVEPPAGVADPDSSNDSDADLNDLTLVADLAVTKDDGQTIAVPGETISYLITVTNAGPSSVTSVSLIDDLPAALFDPLFTPSTGDYDSATGAWTGLDLAPGSSVTLTLDCTIDPQATGELTNVASVAPPAGVTDPDTGDNTDADTDLLETGEQALTVTTIGLGTVTSDDSAIDCGIECDHIYPFNSAVTLRALAAPSWIFDSWGGDCSGG